MIYNRSLGVNLCVVIVFTYVNNVYALCKLDISPTNIVFSRSKHSETKVQLATPYFIDTTATQLKWRGEQWQASHDFVSIAYPSGIEYAPATNGFLHVLRGGYTGKQVLSSKSNLVWELLPTLAVSSNQLKNPDLIETGTFRFAAQVIAVFTTQLGRTYYAGICSNAMTGEYKIIPTLGFSYKHASWDFTMGYPSASATIELHRNFFLFTDWSLAGNSWQILDANLQHRSDLQLESQHLQLGLRLGNSAKGLIKLSWSYRFEQKLSYVARNGTNTSAEVDASKGWLISIRYYL